MKLVLTQLPIGYQSQDQPYLILRLIDRQYFWFYMPDLEFDIIGKYVQRLFKK